MKQRNLYTFLNIRQKKIVTKNAVINIKKTARNLLKLIQIITLNSIQNVRECLFSSIIVNKSRNSNDVNVETHAPNNRVLRKNQKMSLYAN